MKKSTFVILLIAVILAAFSMFAESSPEALSVNVSPEVIMLPIDVDPAPAFQACGLDPTKYQALKPISSVEEVAKWELYLGDIGVQVHDPCTYCGCLRVNRETRRCEDYGCAWMC